MRLAVGITTISAAAPPETRTKRPQMRLSFSLFPAPPMGTIQPRAPPGGILLGMKLNCLLKRRVSMIPQIGGPIPCVYRSERGPPAGPLSRRRLSSNSRAQYHPARRALRVRLGATYSSHRCLLRIGADDRTRDAPTARLAQNELTRLLLRLNVRHMRVD